MFRFSFLNCSVILLHLIQVKSINLRFMILTNKRTVLSLECQMLVVHSDRSAQNYSSRKDTWGLLLVLLLLVLLVKWDHVYSVRGLSWFMFGHEHTKKGCHRHFSLVTVMDKKVNASGTCELCIAKCKSSLPLSDFLFCQFERGNCTVHQAPYAGTFLQWLPKWNTSLQTLSGLSAGWPAFSTVGNQTGL